MARVFTANLIMASGSKWGELRLDITPGTQNIANNTTAITYELYLQRTATNFGGYWSDYTSTATLTINGTPITVSGFTYNFGTNYKKSLKTGSMTITHSADGTKTISASASVTLTGNVPSGSGSGNLTLATIPRASSFTLGGSTQTGSSISVAITRASDSFTHKVRWRVGTGSWNDVSTNATISATFTVPHSAFPNSTSGTITVGVQTLNGTTNIGSERTTTRALTVPTSIKPKLTGITHSDTVTLVKNAIGAYVQNNTKLSLAITGASAGEGATITAYSISVAGQTINARTGTTNVITASGSMDIIGTVTDSRGRVSDTFSVPISVLPYSPPSITGYSAFRSDSSGNTDFFNTWATVRFKTSVSSLNSKNTATYQIRSKLLPSGTWSTKTSTTAVGISTNVTKTYIDYARTSYYQFEIVISDKLSVVTIANDALMIPTAGVPFLAGHGGIASSFGKIPTHGTTYDLEIGDKGLKLDGPLMGKEGPEISYDSLFIPDKRNDNQPPSWYYSNYPHRTFTEFKLASAVGLTNASGNFVALETIVPWYDGSGGEVRQIAWGNNNEAFYRTSLNNTTWRAWEQLSTNKKGAVNWANNSGTATNISTVNQNDSSLQRVSFLSTQTITVSSDNATVIVQGSVVAQASGRIVLAKVKLGNLVSTTRAVTNRNVPHTLIINEVFTGVSKGNHTVELVWGTQDNTVTGTIPAYTSATIVAWEL